MAKSKAAIGHNSARPADQLKSFVARIESLEGEKSEIAAALRDVYEEAKGSGFDVKVLRSVIRLRKQDAEEREAEQELRENYMTALGMLSDTPLGQAAMARDGLTT